MFDTHYDLLTLAFMAQNEKIDITHLLTPLNKKNISGVIGNLYFMSEEEMKQELKYPNKIDVLKMFKQAKQALEQYNLDCNILYSIEGCDYIKDIDELEKLKKAGLNSIILVWNNKSKYGSGIKSNEGLTEEGKHFVQKAIDLKLGIDLSHANEPTFNDIINIIKENQKQGKQVICYASHSNIKTLQNNPRNLNDHQLQKLKEVGGYLGLVSYPSFITDKTNINQIKQEYINHIIYATKQLDINHIMLSSDNMDFIHEFDTNCEIDKPVYKYENMKEEIYQDLEKHFTKEDINKIMKTNAETLYQELTKSHQ